jgi:hypothetical protein
MTNAQSETEQMEICCQNLTLDALSSHSALSVLVGALFKKFSLFISTLHIMSLFICMLGQSNYFYQLLSEVLLVF